MAMFLVFVLLIVFINKSPDHPRQVNPQQNTPNHHNHTSDNNNTTRLKFDSNEGMTFLQILESSKEIYNNLRKLKQEINRNGEDGFVVLAVFFYTKTELNSNNENTIRDILHQTGFTDKDVESTLIILRKIELLVGDQHGSTQFNKWTNFNLTILAISIALYEPIAECGKEFKSQICKLLLKAMQPDVAKSVITKVALLYREISNQKLQLKASTIAEMSLCCDTIPENKLQLLLTGYLYIYAFKYIWNTEHGLTEDDNDLEKIFSDLELTCSSVVFYSNDYKPSKSISNIVNKSQSSSVIKNIEWLNSQKQDVFGIRVHSYMNLANHIKSLNSGELPQSDITELINLVNNVGTVVSFFKLLKEKQSLIVFTNKSSVHPYPNKEHQNNADFIKNIKTPESYINKTKNQIQSREKLLKSYLKDTLIVKSNNIRDYLGSKLTISECRKHGGTFKGLDLPDVLNASMNFNVFFFSNYTTTTEQLELFVKSLVDQFVQDIFNGLNNIPDSLLYNFKLFEKYNTYSTIIVSAFEQATSAASALLTGIPLVINYTQCYCLPLDFIISEHNNLSDFEPFFDDELAWKDLWITSYLDSRKELIALITDMLTDMLSEYLKILSKIEKSKLEQADIIENTIFDITNEYTKTIEISPFVNKISTQYTSLFALYNRQLYQEAVQQSYNFNSL